jgi:hypothetical protein
MRRFGDTVRGLHAPKCEGHAFLCTAHSQTRTFLNKNALASALLDLHSVSVNAWFDDSKIDRKQING